MIAGTNCRNETAPAGLRRRCRARIVAALAVLVVLATTGCAARYISEAQDAFSKGAAIENELDVEKTRTGGDIGLSAYSPAVLYYKRADALLKREIAAHKPELTQDRLLGNVYALRALTLWRLSNLSVDGEIPATRAPATERSAAAQGKTAEGSESEQYRAEAEELAHLALQMPNAQLGARDRFMMTILPRLLDHDTGAQLATRDPARAHEFFKSAYEGIDREVAKLPPRHDAVAYARMAQLQTLVAWSAAINAAPRTTGNQFDRGNVAACRNSWIIPKLNRTVAAIDSFLPQPENRRSDFVASRLQRMGFDVPANGPLNPVANATDCPWK